MYVVPSTPVTLLHFYSLSSVYRKITVQEPLEDIAGQIQPPVASVLHEYTKRMLIFSFVFVFFFPVLSGRFGVLLG